jgi:prevent-host-death family protein
MAYILTWVVRIGGCMKSWQLQKAKARISELVKRAQADPQEITMHGKPVAVLISRETFDRLSQRGDSLVAFMQRSPLHGLDEPEFERDSSPTRPVKL